MKDKIEWFDSTLECGEKIAYIKYEYVDECIRKAKEDLVEEFRLIIRECIQKGLATEMIDLDAMPKLIKKHNLDIGAAFRRRLDSITNDGVKK